MAVKKGLKIIGESQVTGRMQLIQNHMVLSLAGHFLCKIELYLVVLYSCVCCPVAWREPPVFRSFSACDRGGHGKSFSMGISG